MTDSFPPKCRPLRPIGAHHVRNYIFNNSVQFLFHSGRFYGPLMECVFSIHHVPIMYSTVRMITNTQEIGLIGWNMTFCEYHILLSVYTVQKEYKNPFFKLIEFFVPWEYRQIWHEFSGFGDIKQHNDPW